MREGGERLKGEPSPGKGEKTSGRGKKKIHGTKFNRWGSIKISEKKIDDQGEYSGGQNHSKREGHKQPP